VKSPGPPSTESNSAFVMISILGRPTAASTSFRGKNSDCAVVGGKGLVQLSHDSSDGSLLLNQIHVKTGFSGIQCGLNAGIPRRPPLPRH